MRCSEWRWVLVLISALATMVIAESWADGALPDSALRDQVVQIQEQVLTAPPPGWLMEQQGNVEDWSVRLRDLRAAQQTLVMPLRSDVEPTDQAGTDTDLTVTILASRALGEAQLRELFAAAAGQPEVRVVFRGVAPGESLGDFIRQIHVLLREARDGLSINAIPRIEIDPRPFQSPLVEVAPTLITTDGAGKEIARVSGISRPDWLLEQVEEGRRGDLGVRGPTVAVSEPDLIAELQRRLAGIDWSARREAALARYWERASFAELPTAEQVRERRLDLTLVAQADVTLPDGTTVIRVGERVDPLAIMPFRQRLFVFDATDPRQVAEVARRGAASRAEGRLPLYLATRLDREAGWGGYRGVQTALQDPLYLLTPDVRRRFQIERVPAVVDSREGVLVVSEWPPEG
ncbi:Type-F conjugative transfer system pilin assembly protein TrbC [Thiorhodococcus drewsii AZ1]|uniref:Type-F conjugative transfer system pilin assembly protein TrbC n=1 Tax=Thiorhodococcus drewsii AZ1 TaxID=765913 RepID=G2E4J6_9GAMM|nr:Type-F conjugative transfer system pilin assembly protein TrbC [Thiorhodococcus drewsii AZ1]